MSNPVDENTLPVPPELLAWGTENFIIASSDSAPEVPSGLSPYNIIYINKNYTLNEMKHKIATALTDRRYLHWNITFNENEVQWEAEYTDPCKTNEYDDGPYQLKVHINLYWNSQTNKHIIHVNPVQRSSDSGIAIPFYEHLIHIFFISPLFT